MELEKINGVDIEYNIQGEGEPLLLIHASILADFFSPLLGEHSLAGRYRIISYHRCGYGKSAGACCPFTISQEAADGRALLRHLGITRAHIAGHSYGGAIALQWALDAPEEVHSLALLEPPLIEGTGYGEMVAYFREMYDRGEREKVLDIYLSSMLGPSYRNVFDKLLPPGAFAQAIAELDTFFLVEFPDLLQWRFGAEDGRHIRQPVLAMTGSESSPLHRGWHDRLRQMVPHAVEMIVPNANHMFQLMNPGAVAEGLAHFFAEHPL